MLIRLKNCEAVECAYIVLVIQIYKDKNELGDGALLALFFRLKSTCEIDYSLKNQYNIRERGGG